MMMIRYEGCEKHLPVMNGVHLEILRPCTSSKIGPPTHLHSSKRDWKTRTQCDISITPNIRVTRDVCRTTCVVCMENMMSFFQTVILIMKASNF